MSRSDEERFTDILEFADRLAFLVAHGREAYDESPAIGPAIERFIELIGEAASTLSPEARAKYPDIEWAKIIGMRVMLAHHYHRVNLDRVWITAAVDVPEFAAALRAGSASN
ncbi:MAG TPA: HepT-like ribonuclease domain-containing protein [Candidatus Nanopelagicaceae bacterium]|nr:HepT-like ribonuclease domain-containing protein [Candidatus Nanopelagicaceae bacterium]